MKRIGLICLFFLIGCSYQRDIWYDLSNDEIEQRLWEINETLMKIKEDMNASRGLHRTSSIDY